ncbi:unnamed protein product [Penicillium salamii]|uniref:N-terminal acetyltransferase A, auxiliary subunit n=1 Tax=Penicillium camemberti (strain FM 013) TaxID=1429867 RepID=A0A0G4PWX7_PENC3|nr:hypothetical protein HAV15_008868 [Penicillium sp. str. \
MSHTQPSPAEGVAPHLAALQLAAHAYANDHVAAILVQGQKRAPSFAIAQEIAALNGQVWLQIGSLTESMGDLDDAINHYEQALRHNQWSIPAMNAISCILRIKEQFPRAIEYLQNILKLDPSSGETWGSLGHCHLMMDNLQDAYTSYQQALYYLHDPKEPKLWYGIGILYDRYDSLDHAEEAFSRVMRMAPDFEKANEIYFRLGIIYKQQQKFNQSLECFNYIFSDPPRPLTEEDIWFQIGHVHEQQKDFGSAQSAYQRVLERNPSHAKVLQQLGWLYLQSSNAFQSQEKAVQFLEQSVNSDNNDAQSWYLLGRCYMLTVNYPKAYEAYQQAVYRDGRNPTFWCSIGVLFYQINQYRDALDAYSRAIRLNPYISEVWYDLGALYESCNHQFADALDAYTRAANLDPGSVVIKARLQHLQRRLSTDTDGQQPPSNPAPQPHDVHHQAHQATGFGAPPAPGRSAPAPIDPPTQAPAPLRSIPNWNRGINELQSQGQGPSSNISDQRDARAPGASVQSSQQEPGQVFPDPRGAPCLPKMGHPNPYPAFHTLPQIANAPSLGHERALSGDIAFGAARSSLPSEFLGTPGPDGDAPPPPAESRPICDERPSSPGSSWPHQPFHEGSTLLPQVTGGSSIASASGPASAANTAEAAARDREGRSTSAMKRGREWEADAGPTKKLANDEIRARLDDQTVCRLSPPVRMPSSNMQRRNSSEVHHEDARRANENYHSSEGGGHPPSIQNVQPHASSNPSSPSITEDSAPALKVPPSGPPLANTPVEEEAPRSEAPPAHETPLQRIDVDEGYIDEVE